MTYALSHRKKQAGILRTVWMIGAVLLVGFLLILGRGFVRSIFAPLMSARQSMQSGAGELANRMFRSKKSLVREIDALQTEIQTLESLRAHTAVLEDENKSLRDLFFYYDNKEDAPRAAAVVGKPSQNLYNRILIDQGSVNGVTEGSLIGLHGTVLLGIVREVRATTSVVELYSSPSFSFDGVLRSSGITVPVTGSGGGNFEVRVPREVSVVEDDVLTLASDPMMTVGIIKSVTFDPRDPFQTVLARTPVNIQELKYVEIYSAE